MGLDFYKENSDCHDWPKQLNKILHILKKNNCFHSDINPQNVLVKNNKLKLIDFDQCLKISDLKRNIFLKTTSNL